MNSAAVAIRHLPDPVGVPDDDVGVGDDLQQRLLLVRVERQPAVGGPAGEQVEQLAGIGLVLLPDRGAERGVPDALAVLGGDQIGKSHAV